MKSVIARERRLGIVIIAAAAFVSACATQPSPAAVDPPGFLFGLFHGATIFFSVVGSLFTDYRIYAFPNSGFWYDIGYFLGAAGVLGGTAAGAK